MASSIPRRIAQLGRRLLPPGVWEGPTDRPWVSLTFDDGPDPEVTPAILDALREESVHGTFFVVGDQADAHPDLVRRIHDEGHGVGNHTWTHRPLLAHSARRLQSELDRTEELLTRLAPGSHRLFRPPFGSPHPAASRMMRQAGLLPVYWSVVPADWSPMAPRELCRRVIRALHPGAIVVLHAGHALHAGTATALRELISDIRRQSYEIVALTHLLRELGHCPGAR